MTTTSDPQQRLNELLTAIPTSSSFDAAQYTIEVGQLVAEMCDAGRIGEARGNQAGGALSRAIKLIQHQAAGERRVYLQQLQHGVEGVLGELPVEQQNEVAENLELLVKAATSSKPNRGWYEVSANGLLEASQWTKRLSSELRGAIDNLGKALWKDFLLPTKM